MFVGVHFAFSLSLQAFSNAAFTPHLKKAGPGLFVRLTRKLANFLNGLNVTNVRVGDVIEVPQAKATMLVAEGWAEQVSDQTATEQPSPSHQRERTG